MAQIETSCPNAELGIWSLVLIRRSRMERKQKMEHDGESGFAVGFNKEPVHDKVHAPCTSLVSVGSR